jgi:hypothetical protein
MIAASLPLLQATCFLLGFWGLINGFQWLAGMPSLQSGRALGWDLQGLRRSRLYRSNLLTTLFVSHGLSAMVVVQLVASLALLGLPVSSLSFVWLSGFWLTMQLLAFRLRPDGADKMILVVVSGALLQLLGLQFQSDRFVLAGGLWTGGQLTIAYFASGASKVLLAPWRQGEALRAALSSYMWGHRWSAPVVRHPRTAKLLAWTIILLELAFPLALLMPMAWLCAILGCFLLFHLAIAVIMGLNHYPWAFLAAYPSVLLVSQWLRSSLGLD